MELNQLLFQRKFICKQLDRLIEYEKDEKYEDLEAGYCDIDLIRKEFDETQRLIEEKLISKKEFVESDQELIRERFLDKIYSIRAKYSKWVKRKSVAEFLDTTDRRLSDSNHAKSQPSLPKLPLQTFSGDYSEWNTFNDFFCSTIKDNPEISDINKFQYLRASLQGEAFSLVKCLPLTKDNFDVAWQTLEDRYSDKRRIANKHVDALLNLPTLRNDSDVDGMKRVLNILTENLGALKAMGFPTNEWSFLLLHIVLKRVDPETRRRYELSLDNGKDYPTYAQFIEFLRKQMHACEASRQSSRRSLPGSSAGPSTQPGKSKGAFTFAAQVSSGSSRGCVSCGAEHVLSKCSKFLSLSPFKRMKFVKQLGLCFNCFSDDHASQCCSAKSLCDKCDMSHNKLLHFMREGAHEQETSRQGSMCDSSAARAGADKNKSSVREAAPPAQAGVVNHAALDDSMCASSGSAMLSTCVVRVRRSDGGTECARVLLDPGSQTSFMTSKFASRLGLSRRRVCVPVSGLGMSEVGKAKSVVSCVILPTDGDEEFDVSCLILNQITSFLPGSVLPSDKWSHLEHLKFADPKFYRPAGIDILLGAEVYPHILRDGRVIADDGYPSAINSVFGWLVIGGSSGKRIEALESVSLASVSSEESLDVILKKFWEVEAEPSCPAPLSVEERRCEDIFVNGHHRDETGKYVVRLPFKTDRPVLGESRDIALSRLYSLERKLARDTSLKQAYCEFLRDYLEAGHMEPVSSSHESVVKPFYIAHHCVVKESSSTTKLRVVFDGSMKSSNGVAINDVLLTGPKLQQDIEKILLNFRLHEVVFITDVKQMFRGILVHEEDRDFQRILWRECPSQPVQEFQLRTVTYGLSSAPYLAIRTLQQLAIDEGARFPRAAAVLVNEVFVDDVVSGAASLESARELKLELIKLCAAGGFALRKWASNNPSLLEDIPDCDRESCVAFSSSDDEGMIKVLGVQWRPQSDQFVYNISPGNPECTKRAVLSQIAKCYDPLGWLSPVTLFAKCLMQKLWAIGVTWDENLPQNLQNVWLQYVDELPLLSNVTLDRYVLKDCVRVELHGFSDSSEQGYAGVVYLRVLNNVGVWNTYLLLSKSRVAPLKRISLPRLELCSCVIVSRLLKYVLSVYDGKLKIDRVVAWSDSTIALAWIKGLSHEYKTFVANRASECQSNVAPEKWFHVSSADNPADCASRGLLPSQLVRHELWWHGPLWLVQSEDQWPVSVSTAEMSNLDSEVVESEKRPVKSFSILTDSSDLISRYSHLTKLLKVTAWCLRFKNNCLNAVKNKSNFVSVREMDNALLCLIKVVQDNELGNDIERLKNEKPCSKALQRLKPFIDSAGLLRVGGRLSKSSLPFDVKHQIVLPKKGPLTSLIIDYLHKIHLHVGPQTLQYLLQQRYWILSARRVIKNRVFRCVFCFRNKPKNIEPIMGDLPAFRVEEYRAFQKVGVDYCGHFMIKLGRHRNAKLAKFYVCIFVCGRSRAVHLEVVSSLTAEGFINALKRFCSRRGICTDLYSDCGRNFVKANKILAEFHELCKSDEFRDQVNKECVNKGIQFHFNPSYTPHMGGYWEIEVRSFKYHLKRVVGQQTLSYEEFYTIVCQIEAVMNSRPICPLSSDPNDPQALTPGHFLIGQPLVAIPEPDLTLKTVNRLTRWQLLTNMVQHYWKRWSREYLHTLQQRSKWLVSNDNVKIGSVVVVVEDNAPPMYWRLGVIEATHPGADGVVRVVTVRTARGTYRRAVVKICPLPDPSSC